MVGTGLVCGVVVTLLDSLCTGQVYVPVLALLAGEAGWSLRAIVLLALYNLAFIAPLVAVFVLAAFGAGSERMARSFPLSESVSSHQVLPECWMRADVGEGERAQLLETLRFALGERGSILCGTALLGLERIVEYSNDFASELEEVLVSVAADESALPENRTTALRLSADRGIRAVLPLGTAVTRIGDAPVLPFVSPLESAAIFCFMCISSTFPPA